MQKTLVDSLSVALSSIQNRQSLLPRGDATRTAWCSRSWGKPPVPALLHQNPKLNCPMPNSQVHTNILKEFEYLVQQFGIS
ncbi:MULTISPECIES: hypothetical protein [unclassified Nostoc]|uniref:hypothetical protein n=1 Tax=unclassified Nostoc TaxID=2593658 RepID=UPI00260183D5|nr:hypothetical protein [Nostoc sp. S13]MDF5736731.1 hypothetical protein [Nostoc sp. S13]